MSVNEYYTLGRSGLRVSRLALGTMTFRNKAWGNDDDVARELLARYLDRGGNFIDTADVYGGGGSETLLGELIAERQVRGKIVLATKFTHNGDRGNPNASGNGRVNILRAVEASLRRLRTDYLDLYLLHNWDLVTPVEEVVRTLDDLVTQGKVRHVGLSDVPAWYASRGQTIAELRGYEPFCTLQLEYSLLQRDIEHEFTRLATDHGMGIMVWSPLASGMLSGKYRPGEQGAQGRLATMKGAGGNLFDKMREQHFAIVAELEKVAKAAGRSMAQVAINWIANRPGVGSVVLGATRVEQLEDTLQSLDFTLPAELSNRLEEATRPPPRFPYIFFSGSVQDMILAGATVGDKPAGYTVPHLIRPPKKQ